MCRSEGAIRARKYALSVSVGKQLPDPMLGVNWFTEEEQFQLPLKKTNKQKTRKKSKITQKTSKLLGNVKLICITS